MHFDFACPCDESKMCFRLASFHSRVSVFSSWQSLADMLVLLLLFVIASPSPGEVDPAAAAAAAADPTATRLPRWCTDSEVMSSSQ